MNEPQPADDTPQAKLGPPNGPSVLELETLFRRIGPGDLGGRPIYVAFASELPADLRPSGDTLGYHSVVLDLSLKSWLTDSGRWRGRGPTIAVNDLAIMAEAELLGRDDVELVSELYRDRVHAVALHEMAHSLAVPLDLRQVPTEIADDVEKQTRDSVIEWIAGTDEKPIETPPEWAGHGCQFIRTLCHIAARAERLGVTKPADNLMFCSSNYSLSPLFVYRRALRKELEAFDSSLCFDDLRRCNPPREFVELFRADLQNWWKSSEDELAPIHIAAAMAPYLNVLKDAG